jgi:hypothetical protein
MLVLPFTPLAICEVCYSTETSMTVKRVTKQQNRMRTLIDYLTITPNCPLDAIPTPKPS